ncbi:MAG: alpha/beta hydrolase [Paludibacteraceae bacterium]|nr:alpha/beta hydrolase [Paludibacteraceae bacterium]
MKKMLIAAVLALLSTAIFAKDFQVYGPQGGLAMTVTLPEGFNPETDTCPMVILMHGIFASQRITPMPTIARQLAEAGIASIRFNFGGHWSSEGEMVKMTIENEIAEATAMWQYACSLPYVSKIGLLGHSQGGVVASMTAGRIAVSGSKKQPYGLVLIAPASVLKTACNQGSMLGAKFDPKNPPEYVKCFGMMKVSREYILSTQQLDIYGTAEAYNGPVRIIHGSDDTLVPMWCSEDFKRTYGERAELIVVENENHRISRKTKQVAALVVDFFKGL